MVDKLAYVLNTFMEQTIRQVNGNIDFTNLNQELITFKIVVDASGVPIGNNLVRTNIIGSKGVLVISATNKDDGTVFPTATPFITFTQSAKILKIKNITGLQNAAEYELKIVVIG